MTISVQSVIGGGYKLILKCTIFCALLLSFLLLNATFISCAGGASSPIEEEGSSLAIQLPDTAKNLYAKNEVEIFTVTITSKSYSKTKTAGKGETLVFDSIPFGHYEVTAVGKNSAGNITAKGTTIADINTHAVIKVHITLHRTEYGIISYKKNTSDGDMSNYTTQKVTFGYKASRPSNPTQTNAKFVGWYTSDDGGTTLSTAYDFNSTVNSDITLYAKWKYTGFEGTLAQLTNLEFEPNTAASPYTIKITGSSNGEVASIANTVGSKGIYVKIDLSESGITVISSTDAGGTPSGFTANSTNNMGTYLKEVVLPSGLQDLGHGAFSGCSALTSVGTIPSSIGYIGERVFEGTSVTSLSFAWDRTWQRNWNARGNEDTGPHQWSGGISIGIINTDSTYGYRYNYTPR